MVTPVSVRYGGALYTLASHADVADLLVTAAPPRSEEEWKEFAKDIFAFYEGQLADLDQLDEAAAALRGVSDIIGTVEKQYQSAQNSMDIRALRDAMSSAQATRLHTMKMVLPQLKQQFTKLSAIKKARKAHDKLKKQLAKMSSSGVSKWFK